MILCDYKCVRAELKIKIDPVYWTNFYQFLDQQKLLSSFKNLKLYYGLLNLVRNKTESYIFSRLGLNER